MVWSELLDAVGVTLPPVATPLASYVPATVVGDQVLTSGQLPMVDGALACTGKVGAEVDLDTAVAAARACILNALAAAADAAGGVDQLARVVRVVVFVASAPDFTEQAVVANGASDLLVELFGDAGKHVRSAVGVAVLPKNAPVEVELVCQIS